MPRLDAPSISWTSMELPSVISRQFVQVLHGICGGALLAVEGLGQDTGNRRLANAPGTTEDEGVGHPAEADRIAQGRDHVILPDDILEDLGSPLSG